MSRYPMHGLNIVLERNAEETQETGIAKYNIRVTESLRNILMESDPQDPDTKWREDEDQTGWWVIGYTAPESGVISRAAADTKCPTG